MNHCKNHLLVFARVPKVGTTKTRLIPSVGADNATLVYRYLTNRTFSQVAKCVADRSCAASLFCTGGPIDEARAAFGDGFVYREQVGASLGERLQNASKSAFVAGAKRVVVIGTDCPDLTSKDLNAAFGQLENHDVVLGPALDGGYYLIGIKAEHPSLFDEVDWSTSVVFSQTLRKASDLGLRVHALRKLSDVDYPEDLLPLRQNLEPDSFPIQIQPGRLSVIIPTLNEASNLQETLESVGKPRHDLEVIVVDAGSTDQTMALAQQHGCKCFVGSPGRANQMNAGAAIATGEYLLFLHADTRLPADYASEIVRVLRPSVACGAFLLKIDSKGIGLRMIEWGAAFRSRALQMPYGDQALFFRSSDFYVQNGYRQMVLMEDYELVTRMRRSGRIAISNHPVKTSARRWIKKGLLRTTLINQCCVLAYWLGFSDKTIASLYRGRRV